MIGRMMEILNREALVEAKAKLERLISNHKYNQMLAGSSKIPPDPEILWLHKAIELFEKENPFEPDPTPSHGGYPEYF